MALPAYAALWFLPFALPICLYVAYTDLAELKIRNHAVMALAGVFVAVGLIAYPPFTSEWASGRIGPIPMALPTYAWQLLHLPLILLVGIGFNAAGAMGAGDAKFLAAAAPFVWTADLILAMAILAASLLGAFATHRIAKYSGLRRFAPDWKSWDSGKKFPMGLALGLWLVTYLALGIARGS
ncbi:prepilin peptidase [Ruegeria pomeroyi]|uniref:Prepilin peptidase n=1 Tax=Ruegeria alba TaxID=2916756 RepID=A0ABS9NY66_9RHOB|nr:prepilin peptidase [Ruegeria alba]MCE8513226.1 prepilin peptidase [Ruegeria pomeroyi]MCE8522443.1 prepilin peptidase [Ruegeria pomeroyi]MCE8530125.1 prepilin peptidase [Ruegeria pomeroyi]MCE8534767.1 prepilin peptidase [Ruegeria pomeroyi]MCG6558819.1 prepilin peptidase [Ruegeria alba]